MNEVWRDIPGHEGKYQASDQGRIRSLTRAITQKGRWGQSFTRVIKGRILRPGAQASGHLSVMLGHKENGSQVHQLIAKTFIGPQPPRTDVRHLNGNPKDNRLENLCYGTRTENILDVVRIGKAWRKITRKQAEEIRVRLFNGETGAKLAKEFGLSESLISAIKTGKIHAKIAL